MQFQEAANNSRSRDKVVSICQAGPRISVRSSFLGQPSSGGGMTRGIVSHGSPAVSYEPTARMRVKITVRDGVAYVDEVPPGVIVQVTDYDVDPASPEHDETGEPCSRYEVSQPDLIRWGIMRGGEAA
ncbi:MAG: hypothetical protein KJZ78_20800 [Bryobacteraceae bacterium]|nr:hypothetical protein [Bryobacteraceae bacterium]